LLGDPGVLGQDLVAVRLIEDRPDRSGHPISYTPPWTRLRLHAQSLSWMADDRRAGARLS
jgi:hypothetical protein